MKTSFLKAIVVASFFVTATASAAISKAELATASHQAYQSYAAVNGTEAADRVDWTIVKEIPGVNDKQNPGKKLRVVEFEAFDPGFKTYDRVRVLLNYSGGIAGTETLYMGQ